MRVPHSSSKFRRAGSLSLLLLGFGWLLARPAQAQAPRHIVQFTGMVVSGDSLLGVPDVLVYVPKSKRSATTNANGYFSLPVLAGDSVVVKARSSTTYTVVPAGLQARSYSALVQLPSAGGALPGAGSPLAGFRRDFLDLKLSPELRVDVQDDVSRTKLQKTLNRLSHEREIEEKRNSLIIK